MTGSEERTNLCGVPDCFFKAKSIESVIIHKSRHHGQKYEHFKIDLDVRLCELCPIYAYPIYFPNSKEKIKHLNIYHQKFMINFCIICQRYIPNLGKIFACHAKKHKSTHPNWININYMPFIRNSNLVEEIQDDTSLLSNNPFTFNTSEKKFTLEPPSYSKSRCPLCSVNILNTQSLNDHIKNCIYKQKATMRGGMMQTRSEREKEQERERENKRTREPENNREKEKIIDKNQEDRDNARIEVENKNDDDNDKDHNDDKDHSDDKNPINDNDTANDKDQNDDKDHSNDQNPVDDNNDDGDNENDEIIDHDKDKNSLIYKTSTRVSFGGSVIYKTYRTEKLNDNLELFFKILKPRIKADVTNALLTKGSVKLILDVPCLFRKTVPIFGEGEQSTEPPLHLDKIRHIVCKTIEANQATDLNQLIENWEDKVAERIEEFTDNESGFELVDLIQMILKIFPFNPFQAGSMHSRELLFMNKKLKNKLGRRWREKLIFPTNEDGFCVLYCIAIQLYEIENNFYTSNVLAKILEKTRTLKVNSCQSNPEIESQVSQVYIKHKYIIDIQKNERYTAIISKLLEKARNISFPLKITKFWIKKLIKVLELDPKICLNFFYYDFELNMIIPIYISNSLISLQHACKHVWGEKWPERNIDESKIEDYNQVITLFDNAQIDLLIFPRPKTGEFHSGLILKFRALIGDSEYKKRMFRCKSCYSSHTCPRTLIDHLSLCQQGDKHSPVLVFPQKKKLADGSFELPFAQVNSEVGMEKDLFSISFDLETHKHEIKKRQAGQQIYTMVPIMAMYHIYLNVPPTVDDDADIRDLKLKRFPSKIFEGENCVEKMLLHLKNNLYEARDRILYIRERYEKCKLNFEDKVRFQQTTHCEKCGNKFHANNRPRRDHGHLSSRR